jgi:hypothetical protein
MDKNPELAQGTYIICGAARDSVSDTTLFMSPKDVTQGMQQDIIVVTDDIVFKVYSCIS